MSLNYNDIPRLTSYGNYSVSLNLNYVEKQLAQWAEEYPGGLELNPDFQRGHVWTEEQQIKFMEFALRGGLRHSSNLLLLNCADFDTDCKEPNQMVDGLQRLTAALRFMRDEIPVFGHKRSEIEGNLRMGDAVFTVHINNLRTKAEVLQWYLDLNSGGTVHAPEEILRVTEMLEDERADSQPKFK